MESLQGTHIRDSDKLLGYLIKTETRELSWNWYMSTYDCTTTTEISGLI
jgi:hypothetical protein